MMRPFAVDCLYAHSTPCPAGPTPATTRPGRSCGTGRTAPLDWPDGIHDEALTLSDEAGDGRRLPHAGYG